MGIHLLVYPVFHNTMRSIERILSDMGCSWSLLGKLFNPLTRAIDAIQTPMFSTLTQMNIDDITVPPTSMEKDTIDYVAAFVAVPSKINACEIMIAGLTHKLGKAFAMAASEFDTTKPLHAYGMDSLLAAELRNWLAKMYKTDIAVFDIMGQSSIAAIAATVVEKSALRRESGDQSHGV